MKKENLKEHRKRKSTYGGKEVRNIVQTSGINDPCKLLTRNSSSIKGDEYRSRSWHGYSIESQQFLLMVSDLVKLISL